MSRKRGKSKNAHPLPSLLQTANLNTASTFLVLIFVILAGVAIATLAVHFPVLSTQALCLDDPEYLVENFLVHHPSLASASRFFSEVLEPSTVPGYYQPLTMVSLMLDYAAGGRPGHLLSFHRTNLILHVCNTLLVTWLMYLLFRSAIAAGLVGLLFGVHPISVESIAWIAQRKTLLAFLFTLWSLILYVRFAKSGRVIWYVGVVITFILALLSKPSATPLPVCLFLLDYWPLKRLNKKTVLEKIPLLVIAIISAIITFESQRRTAHAVLPTDTDAWKAPLALFYNIFFYLRQAIWPCGLSAHYTFPNPFDLSNIHVLSTIVGALIVLVLLAISLRWTHALVVGWLIFFIAIFPTMGIVTFTNVIAADRFLYLPIVGFLLPAAYYLAKFLSQTHTPAVRKYKVITIAMLCIFAGVLAARTRSYICRWDNTEKLFRYMITQTPDAPALHFFLASELDHLGHDDESIQHYRKVMELVPGYAKTYLNLGVLLYGKGQVDEAMSLYEHALEINPNYAEVHNNMANILYSQGKIEEARERYLHALDLDPNYTDARCNYANWLAEQGNIDEAVKHYLQVIGSNPDHGPAHQNLAKFLMKQGKFKFAMTHYREALRCRPGSWQLANNISWIYATHESPEIRNPAEGIRFAEHACQLTARQQPIPLGTLAVAYAEAGQLEAARRTAHEVIQLANKQGYPEFAKQVQAKMKRYQIDIALDESN